MPILSSADIATQSELEQTEVFQHPHADLHYAPLSDNTIIALKELSDIFTSATIANPTLPLSYHPDTPKLPRVKNRKAEKATRVEEVREDGTKYQVHIDTQRDTRR